MRLTWESTLIIIYNALGEEVYQKKVINTTETIDTKLSNGIYFLKILSNEGYRTQKIIINK